MIRTVLPLTIALFATPAVAACPASPDISGPIDALISQVQAAPDGAAARALSQQMWTHWTKAPDARAQALLDDGMARRERFDLAGAVTALDALVDYCPEFAEGYNQRAFAHFIGKDFEAALPDLERALTLQPRHIPAMTGKGLTLIAMGRIREGQAEIRKALAFNPWLSERAYLALEPETTDL